MSLAAAEGFSKLVTFAAFAYLARVLGSETYGYIEFAGAVIMCASLIVDQGFSAFGAREIAKAPAETGRLTAEIVTARVLLAFGGYLMVVLFALLADRGPLVLRLLLVYGLSLWGLPLLLQWVFQGHEKMHLVALAQMIRQTIFVLMVFAFVRGPGNALMVAWAEVSAVLAAAMFCVWTYRRNFKSTKPIRPVISSQTFRGGVPIGLSQMFWVIKMFGATLILGLIATPQSVGLFAGAQRILVALHTFVWLYYFNLLPSLSRAWQHADGDFVRLIDRSQPGLAWIAVAVAIAWVAFSNVVMEFVYGPEFRSAGTVLALFAGVWAMALIDGHYRYALIAAGRVKAEMLTSALGAVLALILVPVGYQRFGISGAAAAIVIAEAGIWLSAWLCGRKMLGLKNNIRHLRLPCIVGLLVLGAYWLIPPSARNARLTLAVLLPAVLAFLLDHTARIRVRQLFALLRT